MSPAKRPSKRSSKGSAMGPMPKPDEATKDLFRSIVPDHPGMTVRPMFGNLAAFVNGNMFMGLFGGDLFVRLEVPDREALIAAGGGPFEPMPGRAMGGYVVLPARWRDDPKLTSRWVARSLDHAASLPPKQPKPPKKG